MRFADPLWLLLLLVPAALAWTRWRRRRRAPDERIAFPGLAFLAGAPVSRRSRWPWLPDGLRLLGLALLIVALARPQVPHEVRQIRSKARNIMLALDISSSMKAGDFKPGNRLMVARRVLGDFTRERDGDLLGLVIFAGRAFLQAPLTPDTDLLQRMLGRIDIGMLPGRHRDRHRARDVPRAAQGPAVEGERDRAHHRRREQHRQAVRRSWPPRPRGRSACASTPSA